ncbi:iron-sulfur cluster assembly SufBD family protein slr0074-like [Periplaneta americana]|uniref:iron-sulfur cluster assembly SufBD family protein slr0074-like n=1 Tax=Periplaneta americana TaxID=6978 RepID=UPI0037E78A2E
MTDKDNTQDFIRKEYAYGFTTDIKSDVVPVGLSEDIVRLISKKRNEPEYMLEFRLKAYEKFKTMKEPHWSSNTYKPIDYNSLRYYSAPESITPAQKKSLDEVDPALLETFDRLGISLWEQKRLANVAVDAIFDSVSVSTSFQEELATYGIIFCPISEAIIKYPDLCKKYLGSVVPYTDNFFATLNSAVFTDGSFCYIPKGVKSPMDLSSYFRINASDTGQFERTLIIAEEGASVNYIEGCTAPMRDTNQLHAAIVEIIAHKDAVVNYSTVQNWYAGDENGVGGIYNFVTKRGLCEGENSLITWTQVETGSAITWKYPSVILKGDHSRGEFYSVAVTNNKMQADTGTKMIHIGKNTSSVIISKGISADQSLNTYRGLVKILPTADQAKNYTQCDSMIIGGQARAFTVPYIECTNPSARLEHEASTSSISEDQLFYLQSRGIPTEKAISLLLHGFCQEIFEKLPVEFSVEVVNLLEMKLEGSIG